MNNPKLLGKQIVFNHQHQLVPLHAIFRLALEVLLYFITQKLHVSDERVSDLPLDVKCGLRRVKLAV
jgi:hypothetical protein